LYGSAVPKFVEVCQLFQCKPSHLLLAQMLTRTCSTLVLLLKLPPAAIQESSWLARCTSF
jgi:hypothetical protein